MKDVIYLAKKIFNFKTFSLFILFSLTFGGISGLIGGNMDNFKFIDKPSFSPPAFLFPIVWIVLYVLMGISSYIIFTEIINDKDQKKEALIIYIIQLIVNCLWTLFFFRLKWYLFSFFWLILLILLVIIMIYKFYKINSIASYLQIPYLLWILFASILNYAVYTLNK